MKKIGILTFHKANNYGAVLQAYALQNRIIQLGYECIIIDYDKLHKKKKKSSQQLYRLLLGLHLKTFICEIKKDKFEKKNHRLIEKGFNKFRRKLRLSKIVNNVNEINRLKIDSIVLGSDQIWNHKFYDGFDETYFGKNINFKIVSYAASGFVSAENHINNMFITLIGNIDHISVRETDALDFILSHGYNAVRTIDPVFLYGMDFWRKLLYNYSFKNEYILIYKLGKTDCWDNFIRNLELRYNLKTITISDSSTHFYFDNRQFICNSPDKFLSLIMNAKLVVTNSYHATAFSIIFNVEFISVTNIFGNRIKSLLAILGLQSRLIDKNTTETGWYDKINWDRVNSIILEEQDHAVDFLINSL